MVSLTTNHRHVEKRSLSRPPHLCEVTERACSDITSFKIDRSCVCVYTKTTPFFFFFPITNSVSRIFTCSFPWYIVENILFWYLFLTICYIYSSINDFKQYGEIYIYIHTLFDKNLNVTKIGLFMAILVFPQTGKPMLNIETSMPLSDVKNSCLNLAKRYKPLQ